MGVRPVPLSVAGLSAQMLQRKGLRGVEVRSGAWPYHARYIHPRELQLILGFPPLQSVLEDCRAQLALFGNAVSPVHGLWIVGHLHAHLGLLRESVTPRLLLVQYTCLICFSNVILLGQARALGLRHFRWNAKEF